MKRWHITCKGSTKQPELIQQSVKQDTPTLTFMQDGIKFTVEFYNRSDYFACRDSGVDVDCIVVSQGRKNRVVAKAKNLPII